MYKIFDKRWKLAVLASAFAVAIGAGAWWHHRNPSDQPTARGTTAPRGPLLEKPSLLRQISSKATIFAAVNESRNWLWDQSPEVLKWSPVRRLMLNKQEFDAAQEALRGGK